MYKPDTSVVSRDMPYEALVNRSDPDHERKKHREVEYDFTNRVFLADPYVRGAYNQNSNTYPVGQPFGGTDPAYAGRPFYSQPGPSNTKG
jgi:hypothetical protein